MEDENEDSYYLFRYYCEQCRRYDRDCDRIDEHEMNRSRLYSYLDRPKYKQTTLLPIDQVKGKNTIDFMQLLGKFTGSLDVVLKCLRKRNYLHRLFLRGKLEYPCFYEDDSNQ